MRERRRCLMLARKAAHYAYRCAAAIFFMLLILRLPLLPRCD